MVTPKANVLACLNHDLVRKLDEIKTKENVSRNSLVQLGAELLIRMYNSTGDINAVRAKLQG